MERKYKYFIEDADTREWYWFILAGMHTNSSNPHYRCSCLDCRGIETSGFTNDPHQAFDFTTKEYAEDFMNKGMTKRGMNDEYLKNTDFYKGDTGHEHRKLIVTEHEFVLAVTPINTKTNDC